MRCSKHGSVRGSVSIRSTYLHYRHRCAEADRNTAAGHFDSRPNVTSYGRAHRFAKIRISAAYHFSPDKSHHPCSIENSSYRRCAGYSSHPLHSPLHSRAFRRLNREIPLSKSVIRRGVVITFSEFRCKHLSCQYLCCLWHRR